MVRLLAKAQHGDRRALEELFCTHIPLLTRWARRIAPESVKRAGGTDDLVQRTALNALSRLKHLDPAQEDQLQGYLRRSLLNLIRDDYRRSKRSPLELPINDDAVAREPSPLRRTEARDAMRRYRAALSRLTPPARNAITGRFERGLSYEQLARALGQRTPGAARQAVGRARAALYAEMRAGRL